VDINHPEWKQIVNCIVVNIKDMINEYIKEWYKLHKMGTTTAFSEEKSKEERRADLRGFLISKYPGEDELIDKQIKDYADIIGYEDDDFMYGGLKRRPITRKQLRNTRNQNRTQKIHYT
jgi:predicted secreted protein